MSVVGRRVCHWDAVVVTCPTVEWATDGKKELLLMQKNGVFGTAGSLLVIEDAEAGVGSGGATLNALLVAAEHLSAKRGFMVLHPDVFSDSSILILHNSRQYPYDPCGKAFTQLPRCEAGDARTSLSHLLSVVDGLVRCSGSSDGVWVCSTDALLNGSIPTDLRCPLADCVLFAVPGELDYAADHGVVKLGARRDDSRVAYHVADILYRCSSPGLDCCRLLDMPDRVPIVSGVVYLSPSVAETLLALHSRAPSCTYLGPDSGTEALQVSLFFDILAAMANDVSEQAFVAGDCGMAYGLHRAQRDHHGRSMTQVRQTVWKELAKFTMSAVILDTLEHLYWSEGRPASRHHEILTRAIPESRHGTGTSSLVLLNSILEFVDVKRKNGGTDDTPTFIQNCILKGTAETPIVFGARSFIYGMQLDSKGLSVEVPPGTFMMCVRMKLPEDGSIGIATVMLRMDDDPSALRSDPRATVCGMSWDDFQEESGVRDDDLWDVTVPSNRRTLSSARLFPVADQLSASAVSTFTSPMLVFSRWRTGPRVSMNQILDNVDLASEFEFRRAISQRLALAEVRRLLTAGDEGVLMPVFRKAVNEQWADRLLDDLDTVAAACDGEPAVVARVLANIADLLGCLAANEGGLRSGPAGNKDWAGAFSALEATGPGSIHEGIRVLKLRRRVWMDSPQRLIRAARHYEGAAQILVRHAVTTANEFVRVTQSGILPDVGVWVVCECPARVDLFGGWTDTPPICYELGGSVVNASVLLDGKLPIGARVRRTTTPTIMMSSDDGVSLSVAHFDDLMDYGEPSNPGALVKACLLYTKIVEVENGRQEAPLSEQLRRRYGGGFEILTWSLLPRGSGLGTSSILAGAILGALWLASGSTVDRLSIIHAVLCVEQMLTTGGGWQDQVGGLMGGVLHATSHPTLPLKVDVDRLPVDAALADELRRRLVLVYTGKVRLAKNLLQNVLRNWYARDGEIYGTFQSLHRLSFSFVDAFQEGDLEAVGELMNRYWELKKVLAPGAEPASVRSIMDLLRPHVHGQLLCGAGGGGYLLLLTRELDFHDRVRSIISHLKVAKEVVVSEVLIDQEGIQANVDGRKVNFL